MKKCSFIIFALCCTNTYMSMAQKIIYPTTQKSTQVDDYFGTKIADPYRWLEDDTAKNTEQWVALQNKVTNDYLDKIPYRQKLKNRLTELWDYPKTSAPQKEGKYFLSYRNNGLQNQSVLYRQQGLDGAMDVLLDPNTLSKDGTVALQATAISKGQKYVTKSTFGIGT